MTIETKIIEHKGIGRYIGKTNTPWGETDIYEKYIELTLSSGKYVVKLFDNPIYSKNIAEVKVDCGANFEFARMVYKYILKEDEEKKQNLIYKMFSKN